MTSRWKLSQPADVMVGATRVMLMPLNAVITRARWSRAGGDDIVRRDAESRMRIMMLVNALDQTIEESATASFGEQLAECQALGDVEALWAYEGLGKSLAARRSMVNLRGLVDLQLAKPAQLMLLAGAGLHVAQQGLGLLTPLTSDQVVADRVDAVFAQLGGLRGPGYRAAVESLGLVAAMLFGQRVCAKVATAAQEHHGAEAELLVWHGAGRALYFRPQNFLPIRSRWPTMAALDNPSLTSGARSNLVAGYTWAHTLVNMREPEIVERFWTEAAARGLDADAMDHGAGSALIARSVITPSSGLMSGLTQSELTAGRWIDLIERAAAVSHQLGNHDQFDEIFRFLG